MDQGSSLYACLLHAFFDSFQSAFLQWGGPFSIYEVHLKAELIKKKKKAEPITPSTPLSFKLARMANITVKYNEQNR